jgi:hypothetical protein
VQVTSLSPLGDKVITSAFHPDPEARHPDPEARQPDPEAQLQRAGKRPTGCADEARQTLAAALPTISGAMRPQTQQHGNVLPFRLHPTTWRAKLREAQSEREVVRIVREFVAELTPDDIPVHMRPGRFIDATDVGSYGLDLVRHECQDNDARRVVQRLARFLSEASIRLSEILMKSRSTANPPYSD